MHPFSQASLAFLVEGDATLDTITLARFQAHFAFDNDAGIAWSGPINFTDATGTVTRYEGPWASQGASTLHSLLGKRAVNLTIEDWLLTLTFESGELLSFESNDGPYEAGSIYDSADGVHIF
jgi:hypothetical protein